MRERRISMGLETIWNSVWQKDSYSLAETREKKAIKKCEKLFKTISISNHCSIIDIGCGGGYISNRIYEMSQSKQVVGIDFSSQAIELAKKKYKDKPITFIECTATNINLESNSIDIAVCFGLIEHIENFDLCFNEIKRILKQGGFLYLTSSNKHSFMYIHRKIKEFFKVWKYGYQKNWTVTNLEKYLLSIGFETTKINVECGVVDFKFITLLDKIINVFYKNWGRYIIYAGRLKDIE